MQRRKKGNICWECAGGPGHGLGEHMEEKTRGCVGAAPGWLGRRGLPAGTRPGCTQSQCKEGREAPRTGSGKREMGVSKGWDILHGKM